MESRNWIGLVIILAGVVIQPIAWMYNFWLQVLSFSLIFIGAFIFFTQKYIQRSEEKEFGASHTGGPVVPGDIHESSGWGHGGRSNSWSDSFGEGGDGGAD